MNRFLNNLGLCMRSAKLKYGFDTVSKAIRTGEILLVITASDLSGKTLKEIEFICEREQIQLIKTTFTMDVIGGSIGKKTGIIGITDEGFANMLQRDMQPIEEENRL